MKQITEEYCSFEIAKLLKEKGFDELCIKKYKDELLQNAGIKIEEWQNSELDKDEYSAPTHQMALKWLREVYNIHIECPLCKQDDKPVYMLRYIDLKKLQYGIPHKGEFDFTHPPCENTYEQAVEAALLYVLKNLI